jgi:undecaprenyl-diphosphatase
MGSDLMIPFAPATDRSPRLVWGAVGSLAAALALTAIAAGSNVLAGDVWVARAVQGVALPGAGDLARAGYWIGATPVTIVLALVSSLMLVIGRRLAEALLVLGTIAARAVNPALKWAVDSPRPSSAWIQISEYPTGLGFPSSHAMGTAITFGVMAYLAQRLIPRRGPRLTAQAICVSAIIITGFGRIYTGAHWPSDVLGGYLYGGCLMVFVVAIYRVATGRRVGV